MKTKLNLFLFGLLFLPIHFIYAGTAVYQTTSSLTIPGARTPYSFNFNTTIPADATAILEIKFTSVGDNDNRDWIACGGTQLYTTYNLSAGTIKTTDISSCVRNYDLSSGNRICTVNAWNTSCGGFFYGSAGGHSTMEYAKLTVTSDSIQSDYTLTYTAGAGGTLTGSTTQVVADGLDGTAVTAVPNEGYSFVKWSDDETDNPRTDTAVSADITISAIFADTTAPTISDINVSTTNTSAAITWTTNESASSTLLYSENFSYRNVVSSTTLKTSHEINLTNLVTCSRYNYKIRSTDGSGNTVTSSALGFTTTGCSGASTIGSTNLDDVATSTGGTLGHDRLTLSVPTNFTNSTSTVTFQINKIDPETFYANTNLPTNKSRINTNVYNLKAFTDATSTISNFDSNITVTISYTDTDILNIEESSLQIYRYDGSDWSALSSCTVNQNANTVTCTTNAFSDFALFGDPKSAGGSSANIIYGCKDANASNYDRFVKHQQSLCQYASTNNRSTNTPITQNSSIVTPETHSTPGALPIIFPYNLRAGMTDSHVVILQKFLNDNGFILSTSGNGSPGNETNYFGTLTYNALIRFQEVHAEAILHPVGLTQGSGILGPMTQSFIKQNF